MPASSDSRGPVDLARYGENRRHFPAEQLQPYRGKYVAFDGEGTRIVAHGEDLQELFTRLQQAGLTVNDVVWERVPGPGEDTWL
jgi:hypothetical protein